MPVENNAGLADAFCIGCGYALRGLTSDRCPECGRKFDPADPATMSQGRPLRRWQRRLLRPTSWALVFLAMLGSAMLIYLSRWTADIFPESPSVLAQELRWTGWQPNPPSVQQLVFLSACLLWALFLLFWLPGQLLRQTIPLAIRQRNKPRGKTTHRERAIAIAAALSLICVFFGWHERIARRWIADQSGSSPPVWWGRYGTIRPPFALTPDQCSDVLYRPLTDQPTPTERLEVLRLLLEYGGKTALPALCHAERVEEDTVVLQWELRAIGLFRDPNTEDVLTERLDDPRPAVRAAAIDALGILRRPSYSIMANGDFWIVPEISLALSPPGSIRKIVAPETGPPTEFSSDNHELMDDPVNPIAVSTRSRFEQAMVAGSSDVEREAAARAIVAWPPENYRLRIAEWGVWVENDGHLSMAQSIIDEIPPFVHRTGNRAETLDSYFRSPSMVTKPILHVTSDVPMALDIEVHIRQGRPWFAFPYPDDFGIGTFLSPMDEVPMGEHDLPGGAVLADCREGYPWLLPHHRVYDSPSPGLWMGAATRDLGVHWQSLIASPSRLKWMSPPAVPSDPRFAWWTRLRDVPSDWVWNRGEADRFLYYDGPTNSFEPVAVKLDQTRRQLLFTQHVYRSLVNSDREELPHRRPQVAGTLAKAVAEHEGMYIEVHDGAVAAEQISIDGDGPRVLSSPLPLQGDAVVARFRQMLVAYGLTGPEADGLVAAWSPWLFHAEGKRFVLRMSPADYDRQCPMWMSPAPTQVVRLGLALSEFGDAK